MGENKKLAMLTTIDNPFNPFDDFASWYAYDTAKGYNSSQYLARIAATTQDLSIELTESAIQSAIDEIVQLNVLGIYTKIYEGQKVNVRKLNLNED